MPSNTRFVVILSLVAASALLIAGCSGDCGSVAAVTQTPLARQSPDDAEFAVVLGRTLSLSDAAPVPGIEVSIAGAGAVTDAEGRFVAERVPIGSWLLRAERGDHAILGGAMRVEVKSGVNDVGRVIVSFGDVSPPPAVPVL